MSTNVHLLGGTLGIEHRFRSQGVEGGEQKITQAPLQINYGKFITKKLVLGIGIGYDFYRETRSNREGDSIYIYKLPTFQFIPQAKYFLTIKENKLYFSGNLNLSYGLRRERVEFFENGSKSVPFKGNRFIMDLNLRPSLVYFFHQNLALEATFGYFGFAQVIRNNNDNFNSSRLDYTVKASFAPSTLLFGLNYVIRSRIKKSQTTEN